MRNKIGLVVCALLLVVCALLLVGCAQTVDGKAVAEHSRPGVEVTFGRQTAVLPPPPAAPAHPAAPTRRPAPTRPTAPTASSGVADFDPCGFDDIRLEIFTSVDPATKRSVPDAEGCMWTGDDRTFSAAYADDVDRETIPTTPGVTNLKEFDADGRTVQLFVFEGDTCVSLFDIDGRTVQFTLVDEDFDSLCFSLQIATKLLIRRQ